MLRLPFMLSSAHQGKVTNLPLLADPDMPPGRERLRHLVIGSPEGVRSVIHILHVLGYAEQALWSQLVTVPESGMLITPEQGEMFSLLRREHPRLGI